MLQGFEQTAQIVTNKETMGEFVVAVRVPVLAWIVTAITVAQNLKLLVEFFLT